ncbi:MAG: hypothetical protein ACLR43_13955 [Faecalibacillus faecis]
MSNFLDSLQVELIFSLIIMVVMAIFFVYAGKNLRLLILQHDQKGLF